MRSNDDDRDSLSCALLERIISLCDQFEQSWRAGDKPRIEAFLTEIDSPDALLERLLLLEVDFRKEAGELISPEDYRARFVDSPTVINAVFAKETAVVEGPGAEAGRNLSIGLLDVSAHAAEPLPANVPVDKLSAGLSNEPEPDQTTKCPDPSPSSKAEGRADLGPESPIASDGDPSKIGRYRIIRSLGSGRVRTGLSCSRR